jgi:putative ABC transport system ATP-binding protein
MMSALAPSKLVDLPEGQPLLSLRAVERTYRGALPVRALRDATFDIAPGETAAIVGRSGSGKSTLLNILGLLDVPTGGEYCVAGVSVSGLSDHDQTLLRSRFFGFVFQQPYLLPSLSAQENVELVLRPRGLSPTARRRRAIVALTRVGLFHRRRFLPGQMSGGECQRVTIARALAQQPSVLLCDEPTGNLDERTSAEVMTTLTSSEELGVTLLVVTHDLGIAQTFPRMLSVRDGVVTDGDAALVVGRERDSDQDPDAPG